MTSITLNHLGSMIDELNLSKKSRKRRQHSGVYLRGKAWWIDYIADGVRIREKIGPDKNLAIAARRKRQVEVAEGRHLNKKLKSDPITFRLFAAEYLESYSKPNKRSWVRDDGIIKNLNQHFGNQSIDKIHPKDAEAFKVSRLQDDVAKATVNKELKLLKSILNKAIEWGRTEINPIKSVKCLAEDNIRDRFLEKEEMVRLIEACNEPLRSIVIVALNTGLRRSEIRNLKWHDVDFQNDQICLLEQKNSKKSYVPLNETAKMTLMRVRKNSNSPYIFCKQNGNTFDWRTAFRLACRRAGINGITFHDLRRTFGSQLAMAGIDLNTIRELMRHNDFKTTQQRYAHLSKDHKSRAVSILSNQIQGTLQGITDVSQNKSVCLSLS